MKSIPLVNYYTSTKSSENNIDQINNIENLTMKMDEKKSKIKRVHKTLWGKERNNMRTNIAADDHHKNNISNNVNNHHMDEHIYDEANH